MKQKSTYYYRPIPGSRELKTSSLQKDQLISEIEKRVEQARPPAPVFEYQGEKLGGVIIKAGTLSIPREVFDLLGSRLSPIEQVCYFQFFRLSYGENKNFCRVGKRLIAQRTGLSLRRLNTALEGLVKKGFIKPLHRNTGGTLWRVYHPAAVIKEKMGYQLEEGKKETIKIKTRLPPPPKKPLESPLTEERAEAKPLISLSELAQRFYQLRGKSPSPEEKDEAQAIITELLEEGFTRKQVLFAIEWFAQNFPKEKNLSRLPYYLAKALEEYPSK